MSETIRKYNDKPGLEPSRAVGRIWPERRHASAHEACARTLIRWRKRNVGPVWVRVGRRVYYPEPELEAWLSAGNGVVDHRRLERRVLAGRSQAGPQRAVRGPELPKIPKPEKRRHGPLQGGATHGSAVRSARQSRSAVMTAA